MFEFDRRVRGRVAVVPVALAVLTVFAVLAAGARAARLDRPADPVVLTGADVPGLVGVAPQRVVAFAWTGSAWNQIPVQVDERKAIDLRAAYPATWNCGRNSFCFDPESTSRTLVYADPNTLVGADPNPMVDPDDEIAVMARDAGSRFDGTVGPTGVIAGSRTAVQITDPLDGGTGYVYLFASDGSRVPGAGAAPYVRYTFDLASGSYLSTYRFAAGTNTETSRVVTPSYARVFTDRWQEPDLRIIQPGAGGVDILDRNENQFAPDDCSRSSLTFAKGEGAFLTNTSGPVRAIRAYLGTNSGPMTEKQQIFYADREDDTIHLRVHAIPGIISYLDYSAAAAGMTYRDNHNRAGVTIDGVPDSVAAGPPAWETVDGQQGALTSVLREDTTVASAHVSSFYRDQLAPSVAPCEGDASFFGASGVWINGPIDATAGANPPGRLISYRTMFYDAPGHADGPARQAQVRAPLTSTVTSPGPPSNRFRVTSTMRQRRGYVSVTVTLPGPGALSGILRAGRARVGTAKLVVDRAGQRTLAVRVGSTGRRLAARHRWRLSVRLTISFTPNGGKTATHVVKGTIGRAVFR